MKISDLKKGNILISKISIIDNDETIIEKGQKLTISYFHDMDPFNISTFSRIDFTFNEIENWIFIYEEGINNKYLPDYYIKVEDGEFELLKENRKRKLDEIKYR